MPDLQGYKKWWWGCQPRRINTPTTKRENRETPTHKQASTPRSTHSKKTVGSALLSHNPPVAVPSAQKGLTSRFGKDTGCNPLAKTTNTTNKQHPKKGITTHQSVKQSFTCTNPTHKPPNKGPVKAVLVVNRTVDANTIKQELLLVIGQLVLVSWSPYNVYTPSLSTR